MKARSAAGMPFFFDLDGTLADSAPGIVASLQHAVSACGITETNVEWRQHIGPPLQRMLAAALPDVPPGRRDDIVVAYRAHYGTSGMYMTTLFAGVAELLQCIRRDHAAVYIVTNKPQQPAEAIVRHLDLERTVRRVVGGDPAGRGTKAERAATLVADEGIEGGIFVGDGLDDLHAAERIGARFVLAGWGYGTARVLAARSEVTVLDRPRDLLSLLQAEGLDG